MSSDHRTSSISFQHDDIWDVDNLALGDGDLWADAYPEADAERRSELEDKDCSTASIAAYERSPDRMEARTHFGNCPIELTERRQWVLWRYDDKGTKVPLQSNGTYASTTDSTTWTTFHTALATFRSGGRRFAGIGYVFTADDPYTGIDLDDVVVDGRIVVPEAQRIVDVLDSYAEISPSGAGVKLWVRGSIPHSVKQRQSDGWQIEMYDQRRYFTVTGEHLRDTPVDIRPAHDALARLYDTLRPARPHVHDLPRTSPRADDERARRYAQAALVGEQQKMLDAQQGERHNTRYSAACRLGSLMPALVEQEIFDALAVNFGHDQRNAEQTIRDGIRQGQQNPATIPPPRPYIEQPTTRHTEHISFSTETSTDANTDASADPRDVEIARLRQALAASEQRRAELETWRHWQVTVLRKPSEQLSANDKLTALSLRPEMDYRKSVGISEAHAIFIDGACANIGASPGTYGASLRNLADVGALERKQTRDPRTGHSRILIRPLAFDTPELWTKTAARNHGGKRTQKPLEPAPVCTICGPEAPSYTQVTTTTAYICGGCGDIVDEQARVSKVRLNPASIDTPPITRVSYPAPRLHTVALPSSERSAEASPDEASGTPDQGATTVPNPQVDAPPNTVVVPLRVKLQVSRRGTRRRPP